MRHKTLVTGSGGLLGHAVREICPEAFFVTSRDCDLMDPHKTLRLFRKAKPDRVIHLAAQVGGVKKNAAQNADLLTSNVMINTNVLNAARECGVSRLLSVISSCAYRVYADRPSCEEDLHEGLPFAGNLGYGFSKRLLDIQTRLLYEQYQCRFSTITPVTIYGPNDNWDLEDGHVVASLIHKCHLAKARNKPLEVWGSGRAVRQFVFSHDAARVLARLLDMPSGPQTVIVAPDSGVAIRELAEAVAKAMDFAGPIVFDGSKPEGQLIRVLRSKRFSELFPDFKFTPLDEGLRKTARWFLAHEDEARGLSA